MEYLLELKQFFDYKEIETILNNYERTSYLSSTNLKKLIRSTGSPDIYLRSIQRAKRLYDFIETVDLEYIDDRLLSIFDTTSFNYQTKLKLKSSDFSSGSIDIDENYHQCNDKITYLSAKILKMILLEESNINLKYQKDREEKKAGLVKYALHGSSVINKTNNIYPAFVTTATHKTYTYQMDYVEGIYFDSISYSDLYNISNSIKNRINTSVTIGGCESTRITEYRHISHYTNYDLPYSERLLSMFELTSTIKL